jgi:hypothetical protein
VGLRRERAREAWFWLVEGWKGEKKVWKRTDDCFELFNFFSWLELGRDRPEGSCIEEPLYYLGLSGRVSSWGYHRGGCSKT